MLFTSRRYMGTGDVVLALAGQTNSASILLHRCGVGLSSEREDDQDDVSSPILEAGHSAGPWWSDATRRPELAR